PMVSTVIILAATAPTNIHTLSLHDALPISVRRRRRRAEIRQGRPAAGRDANHRGARHQGQIPQPEPVYPGRESVRPAHRRQYGRSEEHTSELQSRENLVCRLLLEKKKKEKT